MVLVYVQKHGRIYISCAASIIKVEWLYRYRWLAWKAMEVNQMNMEVEPWLLRKMKLLAR